MAHPVVQFPPLLDISDSEPEDSVEIRAAKPVRGAGQWDLFGQAANWAIAKGGTLVQMGPSYGVGAGGTVTWRFYCWPRYQTVARLWCLSVGMNAARRYGIPATPVADWHATGTFMVGATTLGSWAFDGTSFGIANTFRFIEMVAAPDDTPGEVTATVTSDSSSGSEVFVEAIACYEIPRAVLTDFGKDPSPYGAFRASAIDPATLQTGAIITEGSDLSRSVDGLLTTVLHEELLLEQTRRSCFFSWYYPVGLVVGTSYTNLFMRDPAILSRIRYSGETDRSIAVAVYGSGPAGSGMQFTTASGSFLLGLPTSDGWAVGTIDVETEDPANWATSGGLRGGSRDRVTIEARRVGAGTCRVRGVCFAESPH